MTDSESPYRPPVLEIPTITQALHELGLPEITIAGKKVFAIEFKDGSPTPELIEKLKTALSGKKVSVELGPTSDLSSLLFARTRIGADVVIGIDPFFDFSEKPELSVDDRDIAPTILLKGDGWGDLRIQQFFGDAGEKANRLAQYAQLICPDSDSVGRMMNATMVKTSKDFMIVLDSGALEVLQSRIIPETDVKYSLLKQAGYSQPTDLDWIININRKSKITEVDSEVYRQGMEQGIYPPTSYIRAGKMLIFENQPSSQLLVSE